MNTFQKINLITFILLLFPIFCVVCAKCEASDNNEVTVGENTHQIEHVTEAAETTNIKESEDTIDVIDTITEDVTTENAEVTEEATGEAVEIIMYFTEKDIIALAKVLYSECRGVPSDMEKACVAWTACNRVDAEYGDTIYDVLTTPNQFAYHKNTPVTEELYDLALDVLTRWNDEKNGITSVGRVLPKEYMWFRGDGKHNYFRNAFSGKYDIWDYSLDNPYDN